MNNFNFEAPQKSEAPQNTSNCLYETMAEIPILRLTGLIEQVIKLDNNVGSTILIPLIKDFIKLSNRLNEDLKDAFLLIFKNVLIFKGLKPLANQIEKIRIEDGNSKVKYNNN